MTHGIMSFHRLLSFICELLWLLGKNYRLVSHCLLHGFSIQSSRSLKLECPQRITWSKNVDIFTEDYISGRSKSVGVLTECFNILLIQKFWDIYRRLHVWLTQKYWKYTEDYIFGWSRNFGIFTEDFMFGWSSNIWMLTEDYMHGHQQLSMWIKQI